MPPPDSLAPAPKANASPLISSSFSSSTHPSHTRRPSLHVPLPPRAVPLPVPQRHGSFHGLLGPAFEVGSLSPRLWSSGHVRRSGSNGSFGGSTSLSNSFVLGPAIRDESPEDNDSWLDFTVEEVTRDPVDIVPGETSLEHATEILIKNEQRCLLISTGNGFGLFDFADLNTVLLLVLATSSSQASLDTLDERSQEVISCLKRGARLGVGTVCDISQKNPCSLFTPNTPLRRLLPLFASGVHRVVITSNPPTILSSAILLAFLAQKPPPLFRLSLAEIDLPLHPLISLSASASVLDAMQVMSLNGLSALGVLSSESEREAELSSLVGVVTVVDCSKLVVPSEGKQALGMGLGDMCKNVLVEDQGRERGEERVPVNTITPSTTVLYASNLILATSSSRVFMRAPPAASPPLSPVSSLGTSQSSPPSSPSLSSVSIGLPTPPSTQLSPQYVISILDILSCLARSCHSKLLPLEPYSGRDAWDLLPDTMSKRRRRASSSAAMSNFETWRWADNPAP